MSDETKKKRKLLFEALEKGVILDGAVANSFEKIDSYVSSLGLIAYEGKVTLAGRDSNGYSVAFETGTSSYGSMWPKWAFNAARDALLHGRKLYVVADGDPFGFNLIVALTTAQPA